MNVAWMAVGIEGWKEWNEIKAQVDKKFYRVLHFIKSRMCEILLRVLRYRFYAVPHSTSPKNCKKSEWITKKSLRTWQSWYESEKVPFLCDNSNTIHFQDLSPPTAEVFTFYFSFGIVVAIVVKEGNKTSNFNRNGYFSTSKCQFVVLNGF